MTSQRFYQGNSSRFSHVMSEEQLEQIIDAILGGKYSMACVLLLQFMGYNPLHYIPYRTYNRLMKDKRSELRVKECASSNTASNSTSKLNTPTNRITDLAYMEQVDESCSSISGGSGFDRPYIDIWINFHAS
ncbi:MAG: HetP family heterocyst commitment protein [Oscillatoriales cyanobacterium RM1_1_9]|nr:HetP family heterocyst commitment protein [Oscillatoriales cyanobacterium SM2_3_0]NJO47550.1 HetP family heterocyst commitment protein [Oscillatoriales cyanobacterium RM2_1_1]NJO72210.1 HetP family heterocyst commitment protein [Oscillatoriales cyanobacterium RM1_1_9]